MHERKAVVLLVVEDDQEMRSLLCDELMSDGYQLREAATGEEALSSIGKEVPDLILTDLKMPSGGLEYVSRLRQAAPCCPIVLMTAFGEQGIRQEAFHRGATAYFDKPVRIAELKATIKRLLDHQRA
ncbi:MAG: response regulator [Nitrospirota bacterium]